jgi:YD repeat-containing protein
LRILASTPLESSRIDGADRRRLLAVTQPDPTQSNGTSQIVCTYDLLDDLTTVNFLGQTRSFAYDGLGRQTAACNPESVPDGSNINPAVSCSTSPLPQTGVVRYTYDSNGNLHTRTDARGIVTTYGAPDGLNRPTGVTYSDGTSTVRAQTLATPVGPKEHPSMAREHWTECIESGFADHALGTPVVIDDSGKRPFPFRPVHYSVKGDVATRKRDVVGP